MTEEKRDIARSPLLFWSLRSSCLIVLFVSLVLWGITGFDVEEGAVPLIGIQWSTVATFVFWFYAMIVSYQVDGLKSFAHFASNLRFDLDYFKSGKKAIAKIGEAYQKPSSTPAILAILISLLVCVSALFAFEDVWVPLYDFFQFGSWLWPVYYANVSSDPLGQPWARNLILGILTYALAIGIFDVMRDFKFEVRLRLDFAALWFVMAAAALWIVWIVIPGPKIVQPSDLTPALIQGPLAHTFNAANCYVFPKQAYFPQDTYTFYQCSLFMRSYHSRQILGFFVPDVAVHSVNVLTKFMTFAAICYPAMVLVKRLK